MRAIILAAGIGMRLGGVGKSPKCLLEFGGVSLLARHLDVLESAKVSRVTIGVGYQAGMIAAELERWSGSIPVDTVFNPDFRLGNIVTLWHLRQALTEEEDVLLMDAEVLYDQEILNRLVASPNSNCFLMDQNFEPGDEPVKLCLRGNRVVEFGKSVDPALVWDTQGESVGFFKLSGQMAVRLRSTTENFIADGRLEAFYEDALRQLALENGGTAFGVEDVTGRPWIEIDFSEDIDKARREVLPALAPPMAA